MLIALPPSQLLEIAGADAVAFAHAQFCNDVRALANGHWQWNAWLSPQGRVCAFFLLLRDGDERLRLLLRGGDAETLRAALARFVFRAKVQLSKPGNAQVAGIEAADELPSYLDTTLSPQNWYPAMALPAWYCPVRRRAGCCCGKPTRHLSRR